jgi:Tfp pilus assembly protein PilF
LIAVFVVSVWLRVWRNPDEGDRMDLILFACGIVALLVHALVGFPLHLPASSLVLVLVAGLMLSRAYGTTAEISVRLRGWRVKGVTLGLAAIGLIVSVFSVSDLHANVLLNKGILEMQRGYSQSAIPLLERSIRYDFAPRQAFYFLAVAQMQVGRYDEALANLERCFTRFVDEAVYLNYGNLTANLGHYSQAREALDWLLASHPPQEIETQARYIRAMVISQQGDSLAGAALLTEIIEHDPDFTSAYLGLGLIRQARGYYDLARSYYTQALERIVAQLDAIETRIAAGGQIAASEYGQLVGTRNRLQQERDTALQRLDALPPPE